MWGLLGMGRPTPLKPLSLNLCLAFTVKISVQEVLSFSDDTIIWPFVDLYVILLSNNIGEILNMSTLSFCSFAFDKTLFHNTTQ